MEAKGVVRVKNKLEHTKQFYDEIPLSAYEDKILTVMDIAVDGSSYMCVIDDKYGQRLIDIDKRDICYYTAIESDRSFFMDFIKKISNGTAKESDITMAKIRMAANIIKGGMKK